MSFIFFSLSSCACTMLLYSAILYCKNTHKVTNPTHNHLTHISVMTSGSKCTENTATAGRGSDGNACLSYCSSSRSLIVPFYCRTAHASHVVHQTLASLFVPFIGRRAYCRRRARPPTDYCGIIRTAARSSLPN